MPTRQNDAVKTALREADEILEQLGHSGRHGSTVHDRLMLRLAELTPIVCGALEALPDGVRELPPGGLVTAIAQARNPLELYLAHSCAAYLTQARYAVRQAMVSPLLGGAGVDGSAHEITLAEAAEKHDVPKSAWTRAAQKKPDEPGYLPTRKVGRNRFVRYDVAKRFADDYEARREQRTVGSRSNKGRDPVAVTRGAQEFCVRNNRCNPKQQNR